MGIPSGGGGGGGDDDQPDDSGSDKMGGGAIFGIVFAVLVVLAALFGGCYYYTQSNKPERTNSGTFTVEPENLGESMDNQANLLNATGRDSQANDNQASAFE